MTEFWLCFVPLFVAVDAIGVLPMFIALTEGLANPARRRIIAQSVLTAMAVALLFTAIGRFLLQLLGITLADFMVAGGALLFVLSITDLLAFEKKQRSVDPDSMGAVPLGVPLITGPAVLTTTILLVGAHGHGPTIAALVINIGLAGATFWLARPIHGLLGKAGSKTISKLASVLLAAIAVMMIRKGVTAFVLGSGTA